MTMTPGRRYVAETLGTALLLATVVGSDLMFGLDVVQHSEHARSTQGEVISEFVATFGLWFVIATSSRANPRATPAAVALYIVAAYWFTASTSFANPAVTGARSFTATFAGVRIVDVTPFIAAQLAGGAAAAALAAWLFPRSSEAA